MRCAIIVVAFLAIAVNSAEIRIDPPSAQCQGEIDRVWLDVIFLVDSSSGMTQHGLRKADAFLESVMRQMTIGEDTYQESRVGIITYAAEAHVVRDLSRSDNSSSTLPYAGDDEANLFGAFTAAVNMFDNSTSVHRKKVIVIAASTYEEEGPHDAVQIAKQFKISGGSIVTIDYRVSHSGLSPLADLASNGFAFTNNDLEVANLFNSFLHVNCFCPFDRHGASSTTYGSPDGGCFDDENIQSDWMAASDLCHEEGGFLVKIENEQKQRTMDNVASSSPYWIGLRFNSAHDGFYWQDWSEMNFTRWASSQPDLSIGECAFSKGSHWYSAPCNGDKKGLADHVFFCEIQPCSANADCYHPVAPNVTEPAFPEVSTLRPEEPSTVLPIEVSTLKPEEPSTVLPIEVSTLKPEEPSTVLPIEVSTLKPEEPSTILPIEVSTLKPEEPSTILPIEVSTLKPEEPSTILPIQVSTLKPEEPSTILPIEVSTLKPEQPSTVLPIEVSTLKPEEPSTILPIEVSTLKPEEPSTVLPIEVSTLKPEEPSTVLPIEVSTMKPEEPSTILPIEVSTLKPEEPSTVLPIEVSTLKPEEPSTILPIEVSTLKPEEPVTEGPASVKPEEPVTEGPASVKPEEPVTEGPASVKPEEPVTEGPVSVKPEEPVTEGPASVKPEEPVTEGPASVKPEEPVTEGPASVKPEKPVTEGPASVKPEETVTEGPASVKPEEPVTEGPASVKPEEPVTEGPASMKPEEPEQPDLPIDFSTAEPDHSNKYFPNGTSVELAWWQELKSTSTVRFANLIAEDGNGRTRYPIKLNSPITFKVSLKNEQNLFSHSFFRQTVKISNFDEESFKWTEIPTYGLLNNMAACVNGVLCPVKVKRGEISMTIDLSAHKLWLHTLQNDAPYQFEIMMTDMISNKFFSFVVQARAYIH